MLLLIAIGLFFRQDINDWIKLRNYQPSSDVIALADKTTMQDSSRRLFYINKPVIADDSTFNAHCRDNDHANEHSIVLGCYLSGQNGIYLLNVEDERLDGVKEVTAAHELLHAAYERLSGKERSRIDALLNQAYVNLQNARVRETIELYRKQDAKIVPNELHSILGTEVSSLPSELEDYYARYFSNRQNIVALSEQYEQAFIERRNAVREYDAELESLKKQIERLSSELNRTDEELKSMRNEMNQLRSSGKTSQYNSMVPTYNSRVSSYNRDVDSLSSMVARYNDIVRERNSVASEEAELVDAIDSRDVVPEQR